MTNLGFKCSLGFCIDGRRRSVNRCHTAADVSGFRGVACETEVAERSTYTWKFSVDLSSTGSVANNNGIPKKKLKRAAQHQFDCTLNIQSMEWRLWHDVLSRSITPETQKHKVGLQLRPGWSGCHCTRVRDFLWLQRQRQLSYNCADLNKELVIRERESQIIWQFQMSVGQYEAIMQIVSVWVRGGQITRCRLAQNSARELIWGRNWTI